MTDLHWIGLAELRAPLAEREGWALSPEDADALAELPLAGLVALSTCNRVEVYIESTRSQAEAVRQAWAAQAGRSPETLCLASGADAVRHLARVSAGLDSAVLGEAQILGQVRRSRSEAQRARRLSPLLAEAFRLAIETGRRVRSETGLGQGVASTASAAVALASRVAGGLRNKNVAVVGGGDIGRLLVKHLAGTGAGLTLVSRAAQVDGVRCVPPSALPDLLATTDVVLTGTDRVVLHAHDLAERAPDRTLTVVDLGVPRNVAADVTDVPGVALYDVDALASAVDRTLDRRRQSVPAAEALVDEAVDAYDDAVLRVRREALVAQFRRRAERTRRDAVAAVCGVCADRTCWADEPAEVVEQAAGIVPGPGCCTDPDRLTRTVTTRVLHDLTRGLRSDLDLDEDTLRRLFAFSSDA
ncbi:MAG: glutamyl-tRNA reductase [Bacteroidota bacterium]